MAFDKYADFQAKAQTFAFDFSFTQTLPVRATVLYKRYDDTLLIDFEKGYLFCLLTTKTPIARDKLDRLPLASITKIEEDNKWAPKMPIARDKLDRLPLASITKIEEDTKWAPTVGVYVYADETRYHFCFNDQRTAAQDFQLVTKALRGIVASNQAASTAQVRCRAKVKPHLLKLPGELRNLIYEYVAHSTECINVHHSRKNGFFVSGLFPLLQVCSQTRTEWRSFPRSTIYPNAVIKAKVVDFDFSHVVLFLKRFPHQMRVQSTTGANRTGLRQLELDMHFTKPMSSSLMLESGGSLEAWFQFNTVKVDPATLPVWPHLHGTLHIIKYYTRLRLSDASGFAYCEEWLKIPNGCAAMRNLYQAQPEVALHFLGYRQCLSHWMLHDRPKEKQALEVAALKRLELEAQKAALTNDGRQPKRRRMRYRGDYVLLKGWEEHDEWVEEQRRMIEPLCEKFAALVTKLGA